MDASRFDALARSLATIRSRRRLLGSLAAGALGLLVPGRADAARCRKDSHTCSKHAHCCSRFCGDQGRTRRRTCARCASGIVCGTLCCPPETVGCTSPIFPGDKPGCLCPCETTHDRERNACVPISICEGDNECCSGTCCGGVLQARPAVLRRRLCDPRSRASAHRGRPAAAAPPARGATRPTPPRARAVRIRSPGTAAPTRRRARATALPFAARPESIVRPARPGA